MQSYANARGPWEAFPNFSHQGQPWSSLHEPKGEEEGVSQDRRVCAVMNLFHNVLNDEIYILRGGKYMCDLIQVQNNEPVQSSVSLTINHSHRDARRLPLNWNISATKKSVCREQPLTSLSGKV